MALLSLMMISCMAVVARAQGNTRGTSSLTLKGKTISVDYGRPALKGRTTDELLGRLNSGGVWRLGANTSTTLKTGVDLAFGDVTVPAGEYSIWMQRQGDNSWKLLFDKQHGQWGEPAANPADCFASTPLTSATPAASTETLTITLGKASGGGKLTIKWGTLEVSTNFKAK